MSHHILSHLVTSRTVTAVLVLNYARTRTHHPPRSTYPQNYHPVFRRSLSGTQRPTLNVQYCPSLSEKSNIYHLTQKQRLIWPAMTLYHISTVTVTVTARLANVLLYPSINIPASLGSTTAPQLGLHAFNLRRLSATVS